MRLVEPANGSPQARPGRPARVPTTYTAVERPATFLLESDQADSPDTEQPAAETSDAPNSQTRQSDGPLRQSPDGQEASANPASATANSPQSDDNGTSATSSSLDESKLVNGLSAALVSSDQRAEEADGSLPEEEERQVDDESTRNGQFEVTNPARSVDGAECVQTEPQHDGTSPKPAGDCPASSAQSTSPSCSSSTRSPRGTSRSGQRKRKKRRRGRAKKR